MPRLILAIITVFVSLMNLHAQTPEQLAEIWDKQHVSNIMPSDARHADLKQYLENLKKIGLKIDDVGRSFNNREIYQIEWGKGPLKVFMWSQMHGDEPTATSALVDMFTFLQNNRELDWVKRIEEKITLRAVPMLNPDGAEAFTRRNAQAVDINRGAINLATPEARLLKRLRDDWSPAIGFNLHNQGALTTVGRTTQQAAISLLVVYGDAAKTVSFGVERNRRVASAIVVALQKFIPGSIAQYSDEWTSTAFGDNFGKWGTATILIETGALYPRDEMFLVKMNFVAFLTALDSLASSSEASQSPRPYLDLPENTSGSLFNFIFRRANIVNRGAPSTGDIAVNTERRRAGFLAPSFIRDIGRLNGFRGLEEYDASGFYVVQRFGRLRSGELAELNFYKKNRVINWTAADLERRYPPDAVFSTGKFIKGDGLVPKR